jgi:dephospho-CoA kinase
MWRRKKGAYTCPLLYEERVVCVVVVVVVVAEEEIVSERMRERERVANCKGSRREGEGRRRKWRGMRK